MITSVWIAFVLMFFVMLLPILPKLWEIRQELRPGYVRAVIIDAGHVAHTYYRKTLKDDILKQYVTIKEGEKQPRYLITPDDVVRRGMFRFPYYYYNEGNPNPINMFGRPNTGEALKLDAVARQKVTSDLFGSFKEFDLQQSMILVALVGVIVVIVGIGVYRGIDADVKTVIANQIRIDPELAYTPTPIPVTTPTGR